jgi:excisionase family DNA binding protein
MDPLSVRAAGLEGTAAGHTLRQLLTPTELSDWLQVPKQTLYKWRTCGDGPRGYRVGKHVRYDVADVEHWLANQRRD